MQVLLNADARTDGRQAMSDYLEAEVKMALGHFGERITRVEAHLSEAKDSTKATSTEIQCGDWLFSRRTGAEIDPDLGWGESQTGSFILPALGRAEAKKSTAG